MSNTIESRDELIEKVLDATIHALQDNLLDYVLVGEDHQSGAWGYRILGERIKDDVKNILSNRTPVPKPPPKQDQSFDERLAAKGLHKFVINDEIIIAHNEREAQK